MDQIQVFGEEISGKNMGAKGLLLASFHLCFVLLKLASNSRNFSMPQRASMKTICNHNKISKKTPPSFISKVVMRVFDGVANIYRNCDISGNRLLLSKNLAKKLLFATLTSSSPRHKVTWFPQGKVPCSCSAVNWSSRFSYIPPFFSSQFFILLSELPGKLDHKYC